MRNDKWYYKAVIRDYKELKEYYPLSYLTILPTRIPEEAVAMVVAVDSCTIDFTKGTLEDYTGAFSRLLRVEIPFDYRQSGCKIYGGKWINRELVRQQYRHFNGKDDEDGNHNFCVGVPASFKTMDNVILECVRTADNMLTAYRRYITGKTDTLEIISFSHGSKGEKEYERDQRKKK